MSKPMTKKKVFTIKLIIILILGLLTGISCIFARPIEKALGLASDASGFAGEDVAFDEGLSVHYLDVGQGDSTLICLPDGTTMLIDASEITAADHIVSYIRALDISTIDYFVVTHADSDHVGGAATIIDEFDVKHIYRPFQISVYSSGYVDDLAGYAETYTNINKVTSKTYNNFIKNAYTETYVEDGMQKSSTVTVFYDSLTISSTNSAQFNIEFFAPPIREERAIDTGHTDGYPTKYYKESNDNSPVILLEYKQSAFVFTGDAEKDAEADFISSLTEDEKERFRNVDVFQAGHHGSSTSNTAELLNLLNPDRIVVSAGKDNKYHHPTQSVVDRINAMPHSVQDYLIITFNVGDIVFGYKDGSLVYSAKFAGEGNSSVRWWHIALGIFAVGTIVTLSVKITSNKEATAKRAISKTKQTIKKVKK